MAIERAFASASFALTAAAYTQVDGMTLTPGAGDFLAFFSMDVTLVDPAGFETLQAAIFVNGVIVAASERPVESENSLDGAQIPILSHARVSPTAGQVVEVRYFSTDPAEFTGFNRELTLFPLGVSVEASATGDDTIAGGGAATMGGMTLVPAAGDHLLLFTTSLEGVASNIIEVRVTIGGVTVPHTARLHQNESSAPNTSICLMIAASINVDGIESVEIEWERVAGGGTSTAHERILTIVATLAADIFQASATADDTSTSTTDELIDGMLITDPGPRNYLALFSASDFYPAIGADAKTTYTIYEDGAAVAGIDRTHEHEDSIDNINMTVWSGGRIFVSSLTSDVQVFWRSSITTIRTIHERTLVIIREPEDPVSQTIQANHEALAEVEATVVSNQEALGLAAKSIVANQEAIGLVDRAISGNYESLAEVDTTIVANHESLATAIAAVIANHEAAGVVERAIAANHEARGFIERAIVANHEAGAEVVQTVVGNHEALAGVLATVNGNHEALASLQVTVNVNHEALASVLQSITGNWESLASLLVTANGNYEALAEVLKAMVGNHEAGAGVVVFATPNHEAAGIVEQTATIPYEAQGSVIQNVVGNHESLAALLATAIVNYEAGGGVVVFSSPNHEAGGSVIQGVTGNHEARGFIISTVVGNHEALAELIRQAGGNYEALATVEQIAEVNHESQGQVAATVIVNWEIESLFLGSFFLSLEVVVVETLGLEVVINEKVES